MEYLDKGEVTIQIYRQKPELMLSLPRLLARLHPNNPMHKEIQNQLYRIEAGYAGEQRVDKYLESIEFPTPVSILTDVHLPIAPKFSIQIDTLILTPSYVYILEIKNIAGTLSYISNPPHFECTYPDKTPILIDCPLLQLNNNKYGLDLWLERNGFSIRSSGLIVLANQTLVKNVPDDMPILYAKHLQQYFRTLAETEPKLSSTQYQRLVEVLNNNQNRYNPYPLTKRYQIRSEDIQKGALCKECLNGLQRINHVTWICPVCKTKDRKPFIHGIQDWFMLIKTSISNEECRDFLKLKDKFAAHYVLKSMSLHRKGKSKSTIYTWDYKISPTEIEQKRKPSLYD
ncbi:transcriptional regulators [Bacillus sp. OxB-1]|uniref:nuclease-related domain-containing protein n=1 Tax=Bacillus sp. (strain OxB-1) TaxID=98228 RepID=UPI000581BAAB|nr:nuclease-related domain-containing protein [Bacillus sp. OxB-1]BAQ10054.1 transcriptional regulators [Bacillus sp. OxB-1]